MKLSVIIVNYNVRYFVEQCIVSVQRATKGMDCEIFVVDNDSADGSVEYLKERFADTITLIESNHNLGFAKANNIAIRQARGEYVLLLNPDTFVGEESLRMVVNFMDAHLQSGAVGVMMHNTDGTIARESRRGLPTPYVSFLKMFGFSRRYYMSHLPWDKPARIDVVSGAFMMLRHSVLDKVGSLDETFFMYGEDIDLSYRVLKAGYENWYVPARIVHYKGESTQKTSYRYVHVFYQAMLIFFRKHYGHLSFLVTLPIKLAIYFRALIALVQMLYSRLQQSLGLYSQHTEEVAYSFKGSRQMMDECRAISLRKGLTVADANSCIVYDTDTLSFEQIITESVNHQGRHIGTYSSKSRVIITPWEIIK
jgi:GT2 family glycosyltransferase